MVTEQIMNHKTYRHYANLAIKSKQKRTGIIKMKKCSNCKQEKPYTEYNTSNSKYADGFQNMCKECWVTYNKAYTAARKAAKAKFDVQSKVCLDCRLEKPSSQFGKRSISLDKLNSYCKPCWRQRVYISVRKNKNGG
jgi:hypothetical protein